jgi:hypothetical protein
MKKNLQGRGLTADVGGQGHRLEGGINDGGSARPRSQVASGGCGRSQPWASAQVVTSGGGSGTRADSEATPHGGVRWWRHQGGAGGARAKREVWGVGALWARRGGNRRLYELLTFVRFHRTFVG